MGPLILFILAFTSLVILIKLRLKVAENKLVGKIVPDIADAQHTEGVLYYFYHPSCGPCRQMLPIIDELCEKYPNRVEKFNIADSREMASIIGISATPTTLLIKNGKIISAYIGAKSIKSLESLLHAEESLKTRSRFRQSLH